jgi:hypothetical protein
MIPLVLETQISLPVRTGARPVDNIEKPWTFDDASNEEVPLPTRLESAMRQARARAYTETRLRSLRREALTPERSKSASLERNTLSTFTPIASVLRNTISGFATDDLGVICPSSWRTTSYGNSLLDRQWLHEVNPSTFDEGGRLIEPLLYMKRPKCIPLLYWQWLKGGDEIKSDVKAWAEGWTTDGPTTGWLARWRDGLLTAKELSGRRRVGFVTEADVVEI